MPSTTNDNSTHNGPWSRVPAASAVDRRLYAADWRVLTLLCKYVDRNGLCYPSQEELAEKLNIRRQSVATNLKHLDDLGYLHREISHRRKSGAFGRTLYRIQYPPFPE